MIPFNRPIVSTQGLQNIKKTTTFSHISGDGFFTKKCNIWFEENFKVIKCLLTTSCTHSLEIAALLCNIQAGDEVIMPSYTFVSTANAFALRGAKIIFVDIKKDTMNINENLIEAAINKKTKAIVPVHYAGVACEMDKIMSLAKKYNLYVIEDAAQAVISTYQGKNLGTIGDLGCYSFHETKNYTMGEGGALLINNKKFINKAEIIREKGTNRSQFFRGEIDKYTWVSLGSSYLPSDINAAYLYAQLENAQEINKNRLYSWNLYYSLLLKLQKKNLIELPFIPNKSQHNAHLFYIKVKNLETRKKLIKFLKDNCIISVFHYIPLHTSPAGKTFARFQGKDNYTTKESEKLLRLPLFYNIKEKEVRYICQKIKNFFMI